MRYQGRVYRPPSEADSLVLQATIGCPHNRCAFCAMYREKRFRARSHEELMADLDMARGTLGPHLKTLFLADGNSVVLSTRRLLALARAAAHRFPHLERITLYGSAQYLERKSLNDWRVLRAAGIRRIHSGLESGHPRVLEAIQKGVTPAQAVAAFRHVIRAGMELSVYIMIGVAGREVSLDHAQASAEVIDQAGVDCVRLRTFVPLHDTPLYAAWRRGEMSLLSAHEALRETQTLIRKLRGPCRVFSDHVSNFIHVQGRIPEDRDTMLAVLKEAMSWPLSAFRPATEKLAGMML